VPCRGPRPARGRIQPPRQRRQNPAPDPASGPAAWSSVLLPARLLAGPSGSGSARRGCPDPASLADRPGHATRRLPRGAIGKRCGARMAREG